MSCMLLSSIIGLVLILFSFLLLTSTSVFQLGFCTGLECVTRNKRADRLFRNCINDGSRPAVHALQRECTNRPKMLC